MAKSVASKSTANSDTLAGSTPAGGTTPTVRNGLGASTLVVAGIVILTVSNLKPNSEVRILAAGTSTELDGVENSGTTFAYNYTYVPGTQVDIVVHALTYVSLRLENVLLGATDASLPVSQQPDRQYNNP